MSPRFHLAQQTRSHLVKLILTRSTALNRRWHETDSFSPIFSSSSSASTHQTDVLLQFHSDSWHLRWSFLCLLLFPNIRMTTYGLFVQISQHIQADYWLFEGRRLNEPRLNPSSLCSSGVSIPLRSRPSTSSLRREKQASLKTVPDSLLDAAVDVWICGVLLLLHPLDWSLFFFFCSHPLVTVTSALQNSSDVWFGSANVYQDTHGTQKESAL